MSYKNTDQSTWTLDQLRTLDAVQRCGSFARAGRESNRTTSAISYAIRTLEDATGLALFDRSGHRSRLTDEGRALLIHARAVLDRAGELNRAVHKLREGWEPEIRVVVDGIFPMSPVLLAMRRFGEERTPTRLRLMAEYLDGVPERFEEERAALMLTLDYREESRYVATPLPRIELVLVAHRDHPVHKCSTPVPRHALRDFVEIVIENSGRAPRSESAGIAFGAEQILFLSDFQAKREALCSGLGFGWLPRHLAVEFLSSGELRAIELDEGSVYTFNPYLVHRREEAPGRGARLFRRLLLESLVEENGCTTAPPRLPAAGIP